jgi:hypothetical protein
LIHASDATISEATASFASSLCAGLAFSAEIDERYVQKQLGAISAAVSAFERGTVVEKRPSSRRR